MKVNTRNDLDEDENLTNRNTSFNCQYLIHSMCFKWCIMVFIPLRLYKGREELYPLSEFATHTLPRISSFLLSSFLSICIENTPWYQYFIFTEKNIFVFTHKENIFTSQFSQIYLFPGISLLVWSLIWQVKAQGPDRVWPGPEWRPEWTAAWRVTEPEPPEDTESWWCTVIGRGFNWDVSRINTEITSLALILVMVTVYGFVAILGRDTLLWYCQDYSAYQSYEIGANICPASWYMWPSISLQQTETVMSQGSESKLSTFPLYNLWPSEVFIFL